MKAYSVLTVNAPYMSGHFLQFIWLLLLLSLVASINAQILPTVQLAFLEFEKHYKFFLDIIYSNRQLIYWLFLEIWTLEVFNIERLSSTTWLISIWFWAKILILCQIFLMSADVSVPKRKWRPCQLWEEVLFWSAFYGSDIYKAFNKISQVSCRSWISFCKPMDEFRKHCCLGVS